MAIHKPLFNLITTLAKLRAASVNQSELARKSMASKKKVIITCAVTGAIHTPSMSKHLPVTAEQIADQAIAAAKAGAAILHLHARDPQNGTPSQNGKASCRERGWQYG